MFLNGIGILIAALLIFALGAVFGARMVYWSRHVTTKSLLRFRSSPTHFDRGLTTV